MMHSQIHSADQHILAIGLIVAALCGFLASCIRFFFRDIAWKSAKAQYDGMGLTSNRNTGWENKNAAMGCIGILACLMMAGVGIALIGKTSTPSPESMQGIVNGTKMYPDSPQNNQLNIENSNRKKGVSKIPFQPWVNNKWTADETPYRKIRNEIDQAILNGEDSYIIAKKAQIAEMVTPNAPLAVFHLGYAVYTAADHIFYHLSPEQRANVKSGDRDKFLAQRQQEMSERVSLLGSSIKNLPDPHSYEFARMRFLLRTVGDNATSVGYAEITMGKYLVEHNPKDWDVKKTFAIILASRREKAYSDTALRYAKEIVHARPSDPNAWEVLGEVNSYFFGVESKKVFQTQYAPASLNAFKKCLELAPADYGYRHKVQISINSINRRMKSKK